MANTSEPPPTLAVISSSQSTSHLVYSHSATPSTYKSTVDQLKFSNRFLVTETFPLFSSLQTIAQEQQNGRKRGQTPVPPTSQITYFSRLSALYRETLIQHLTHLETLAAQSASTSASSTEKEDELFHTSNLHSILTLASLLYLPLDGVGDAVVGEEILEWINIRYPSPSQEESEALASLHEPFVSPSFWPYLYQCVLRLLLPSASSLLSTLSTHHSKAVRDSAETFSSLLLEMPRVKGFEGSWTEFTSATRSYRKRVTRELQVVEHDFSAPEERETRKEWYPRFEELADLLLGKESAVLERASDWRDALGAIGVLVRKGMRRDDVPEVATMVVERKNGVEEGVEGIEIDLLRGDVVKALTTCGSYDLWLAAHLSDLLDKVGAIPDPITYPTTLRDWFILSYASYILTDPGLWRIALDYLSTCDIEGRERMRALVFEAVEYAYAEGGTGEKGVEEVLKACAEFGFEKEAREICIKMTERLVRDKEYGRAVAYCCRAGDAKRMTRIADRILDEYVEHGEIRFASCVDSIPTSLLRPSSPPPEAASMDIDGSFPQTPNRTLSAKLNFLARYRDFQALYARGERAEAAEVLVNLLIGRQAPKSFWAVMLVDALPLLEESEPLISSTQTYDLILCLEECVASYDTEGKDVDGTLEKLGRISGGGGTEMAFKRLEVVRFALARNLARGFAGGF
ncbi:Nucleoporin, Nup85-like protein [Atractiella rhizophila]|nr:Nucleoporin, Nup85-like protein [Atractiella rhizophila]